MQNDVLFNKYILVKLTGVCNKNNLHYIGQKENRNDESLSDIYIMIEMVNWTQTSIMKNSSNYKYYYK